MIKRLLLICFFILLSLTGYSQNSGALQFFPAGTRAMLNISYAHDTLEKHKLDIFMLPGTGKHPVLVWLHSGGWRAGDKQGDMHYMPNTLKALVKNGYAIVDINYRFSTEAIFPAQIIDCNQAIGYIYDHAGRYHLDRRRIAVIGFSAGGHLAALVGLSSNNFIPDFYPAHQKPNFSIRVVIDYFGLSNFYLRPDSEFTSPKSGPGLLFGGAMTSKPDLVKLATPLNYIDSADPPFLILHGTKDELMDIRQSVCLRDSLKAHAIKAKLLIINKAPHGGALFDTNPVAHAVVAFLNKHLN